MLKKILLTLSLTLFSASFLSADVLYVTNSFANVEIKVREGSVKAVDTVTGLVTMITGERIHFPFQVAITPDGSSIFVTDQSGFFVSVIDTATNTVRSTTNIGDNTYGIAISPDGSVAYVTNNTNSPAAVYAIDTTTLAVTTITDLVGPGRSFSEPYFVCFSPDGTTAYVTNQTGGTAGNGSVSIIDVGTHSVIGIVDDSSFPFSDPSGICITPDGSTLYVANFDNNNISVVSTSGTPTVTGIIDDFSFDGPFLFLVSPDGNTLYVSNNNSSTVSKINIPSNRVTGSLTVGSAPANFVIGQDSIVYVTNQNDGTVSAFSNLSFSVTDTLAVGNDIYGLAILPVYSPTSLTGCLTKNVFLTQTDYVNVLNWNPPTSGPDPIGYNIYRDAGLTDLVASLPSNTLTYQDHNRTKGQTYTYHVSAVQQNGSLSSPLSVTVTQSCSK